MDSCIICGCVKDCESYIEKVFENIRLIQKLFIKSKVLISYDISSDFSLKKICEIKAKGGFNIEIIINRDSLTPSRTVNIERARNKLIDKIYSDYVNYDYFIMMDFDDVCSKPIIKNTLSDALANKDAWDGLFFNNKNYYDFWALSFDDFQYSCWHSSDVKKLINIMNQEFKKKINKNKFMKCCSAFGGFGIYKIPMFAGCKYRSLNDLSLINSENIENVMKKYGIQYGINNIYDCEHRYYHLNAIRQNKVRLRISSKCLFPPYIGEHIKILE